MSELIFKDLIGGWINLIVPLATFILSGIAAFPQIAALFPNWRARRHMLAGLVIGLIVGPTLGIFLGWVFSGAPKEIESAFNKMKSDLGNAKSGIDLLAVAAFAVHERAFVFWYKSDSETNFIILPRVPHLPKVIRHPDPIPVGEKSYFNDEDVRVKLKLPSDFKPPLGGLAKLWEADTDQFSWIGARIKQYHFSNKVYLQRFDKGIKFGPVRAPGQIEALFFSLDSSDKYSTKTSEAVVTPSPDDEY